ncbi:hypothetical protein DA469_21530, partial [Bacillus subtilis]
MSFFKGIRNIERVQYDLVQYCDKEFVPKFIASQNIDEDKLYDTIDFSLQLAEKLHLDYNMCFTIAVMHDFGYIEEDENNFNTLMSIKADQFLLRYFDGSQMEIIESACKEHDGTSRETGIFTSLYSKVIADADRMSILRIEAMIRHYWKFYSNQKAFSNTDERPNKLTDKEIFDKMYSFLKKEYGTIVSKNKLLLEASREMMKDEIENSNKVLSSEEDTKRMVLHLANYGEIQINNDGTLTVEKITKEPISESDPFELFEKNIKESVDEQLLEAAPKNLSKRQKVEDLIYKVLSILDDTGANLRKYKEFFGKMNDEQFDRYMKKFLKDEDENFYLEILPNKSEPSLKQIKKALDILKVPTDEYAYLRHDGHKNDPIRTAYKVPVGYITIKRVQQILSKKNTYSLDIAQRNMKSGQVTGNDKIARISDIESYSLVAIGADNALKEFLGPRADNSVAKTDMYKNINLYGYTYLKDLGHDITEIKLLIPCNVYLMVLD